LIVIEEFEQVFSTNTGIDREKATDFSVVALSHDAISKSEMAK
jgi:hypothetical protein